MVLLGKRFLVERGLFILFHMIVALYGMSTATGIGDVSLACNLVDGRVCLWRSDKPFVSGGKRCEIAKGIRRLWEKNYLDPHLDLEEHCIGVKLLI